MESAVYEPEFDMIQYPRERSNLWAGCADQDRLEVRLKNGQVLNGAYMNVAGMTFLTYWLPRAAWGSSHGPIDDELVDSVRVVETWASIKAKRLAARRGEPFPGARPGTALDYEYRLERIARAIAAEVDACRADQLRFQFHETADEIALSKPKRAWLLAAGLWALKSNAPPQMEDLWFSDVASPSLMVRPRAQDFDPDPIARRKRPEMPDHVRSDPASVPNRLKAIRSAGLKARVQLAGDPIWDRAVIQIDLADGRKGRFIAQAKRINSETRWALHWGGNHNPTADRLRRKATASPEYAALRAIFQAPPPVPA